MKLNEIRDNPGARSERKRIGRGIGSGTGKTSGKGQKGQKARKGVSIGTFEGGQMPLYKRLPKRGFVNIFREEMAVINFNLIENAVLKGKLNPKEAVTIDALKQAGLVRTKEKHVKLLAKGKLTTSLQLHVSAASKAAMSHVEAAGGEVSLVK